MGVKSVSVDACGNTVVVVIATEGRTEFFTARTGTIWRRAAGAA